VAALSFYHGLDKPSWKIVGFADRAWVMAGFLGPNGTPVDAIPAMSGIRRRRRSAAGARDADPLDSPRSRSPQRHADCRYLFTDDYGILAGPNYFGLYPHDQVRPTLPRKFHPEWRCQEQRPKRVEL